MCRCGRRAVMKARQPKATLDGPPSSSLRYYYTCDSTKGRTCGLFQDGPRLVLRSLTLAHDGTLPPAGAWPEHLFVAGLPAQASIPAPYHH